MHRRNAENPEKSRHKNQPRLIMKKIILSLVQGATLSFMMMSCNNMANKADSNSDSLNTAQDSLALIEDSINEAALEEEMQPEKEIEALVLHFQRDYQKANNLYGYKTHNEYIVTLHMNGDAEIHEEETVTNIQTGDVPENERKTDKYDTMGAWALRDIQRGSGFVSYYDIEFNNGSNDLNWCVDIDCKYLYFTYDAFKTRDQDFANKILKVDTLYVK